MALHIRKQRKDKLLIDTATGLSPLKRSLYGLVKPGVEGVLGIRKLQRIYNNCLDIDDPGAFCECVFKTMGISYDLPRDQIEKLKAIEGPLVIVCNHPFGGLDAIMLMILMKEIRPDFKLMGNFMLEKISELREAFIFVDPFNDKESKQNNISPLKNSLAHLFKGGMLGVFPAGEVAAWQPARKRVEEPPWNPNIARLILKTKASVVPIYFHGKNSLTFRMASMIHPKLRTALLIREFVRRKDQKIHFQIGSVISPQKLASYDDAETLTAYLRSKTFILGARYRETHLKFDLIKNLEPFQGKDETNEPIVAAVPSELLEKEVRQLPAEAVLARQKEMDVLVFEAHQAPGLLAELGRLREVTFRAVGEGTGKASDLDKYDQWYSHIIIWNREKKEIVGAYRVGKCDQIIAERGEEGLYNHSCFHIRPELYLQINPALELGRSFVRQEYQKSYWSLLLLWTGIGHYILRYPQYHSLIGSVSISGDFHTTSKDLMVAFLTHNNFNHELKDFVRPRNPYPKVHMHRIGFYNSVSVKSLNDVQELIAEIQTGEFKVPPLIKHYIKMGGNIIAFNIDPDFNDVLDGLIYVDLRKTRPEILKKYMTPEGYASFMQQHSI